MGAVAAAEEGKPLMQSGSNTAVYALDVDARRQARSFLGLPASVFAGACYCLASMSMVSRLLKCFGGSGVLLPPAAAAVAASPASADFVEFLRCLLPHVDALLVSKHLP